MKLQKVKVGPTIVKARGKSVRFRGHGQEEIPCVDPEEVFNEEDVSQCIHCAQRLVCFTPSHAARSLQLPAPTLP